MTQIGGGTPKIIDSHLALLDTESQVISYNSFYHLQIDQQSKKEVFCLLYHEFQLSRFIVEMTLITF